MHSTMLSAWFSIAWFLSRGASVVRPSALQRIYTLIWMFIGAFVLLIFATIIAQREQIAGSYFVMFYFAAIFFALLISYVELFFLPKKSAYANRFDHVPSRRNSEAPSRPLSGTTSGARSDDRPLLDDDATETTSLLRGDRRSFVRHGNRRQSTGEGGDQEEHQTSPSSHLDLGNHYPGEQEWSAKLPSWLWIVQFLLLVPIVLILVGQIALILTSALHQTVADSGASPLFIYIAIGTLTTLLVAPTGPFLHRFTHHVPTFLFFVLAGTLIYNLVAFPFSRDHRLKVYFLQEVDCDTGFNTVSITALEEYAPRVAREIPSAQGQIINCTDSQTRKGLKRCAWSGLPPRVVPKPVAPYSNSTFNTWLDYAIAKGNRSNEATIRVAGQNTRALSHIV